MLKLAVGVFVLVQFLFLLCVVKWQNQPGKVGMHVVNVCNVLFFVVVQVAFFMAIASKQLDVVVQQKACMLLVARDVLKKQPGAVTLDEQVDEMCEPLMQADAPWRQAEAAQVAHNRRQVLVNIGPIVLALVLVLLLLVLWARHRHTNFLTRPDQLGLLLVLLAYGTEILFFLLVVRRRVFVGDWDLMWRAATRMNAVSANNNKQVNG